MKIPGRWETSMPRVDIKYDDYKVKAFLDANIILECRPLAELWG